MNVIGLTGMSGAGKSTAAKIFIERGFDVIDCDTRARAVITRSPCIDEVRAKFPEIFANGEFCRKIAARVLFSDTEKLAQYQKIVFPYIRDEIQSLIADSPTNNVLLDAPTLFQSGANEFCGMIIAVVAEKKACIERITARDLISEQDALMRLNNQPNEDFFRKNADYIIENNGDFNEFRQKIEDCYANIDGVGFSGGAVSVG
jgi:dephospho-CoA kinase